jgi:predicted TIM-barrel fold metal-dependent hydrolase
MKFHSRNDIQPVLLQLPVGRQSEGERILRNAHKYGWRGFYVHPEAVGPLANETDLCGINPYNGEHDFIVMMGIGDGGVEEIVA